jgi:hypothetical protein
MAVVAMTRGSNPRRLIHAGPDPSFNHWAWRTTPEPGGGEEFCRGEEASFIVMCDGKQ